MLKNLSMAMIASALLTACVQVEGGFQTDAGTHAQREDATRGEDSGADAQTPMLPDGWGPLYSSDTGSLVPPNAGFLYASGTGSGTASPLTSFNGVGGRNSVIDLGSGRYRAVFPGLKSGTVNIQVVAQGAAPVRCTLVDWKEDTINDSLGLNVTVQCADMAGVGTSSGFVVSVTNRIIGGYLFYSTRTGAPLASYSYPFPTHTVVQTGTGQYTVTVKSAYYQMATAQVTAVSDEGGFCKVGPWQTVSSDQAVPVRCFNRLGSPTNHSFFFSYGLESSVPTEEVAFALANQPSTTFYTCDLAYRRVSVSPPGDVTSSRLGTGDYQLDMGNLLGVAPSTALVTALSTSATDANWCKLHSWGSGLVRVRCFTSTGLPVDSQFTVVHGAAN